MFNIHYVISVTEKLKCKSTKKHIGKIILQVSHTLFGHSRWRVLVTFRRSFRSLTAFAAEWCALPDGRGGKEGRRKKKCHAPKTHLCRPSFSPFDPHARRTIPPVTIETGGISSVQQQTSRKLHELSLRNLSCLYP